MRSSFARRQRIPLTSSTRASVIFLQQGNKEGRFLGAAYIPGHILVLPRIALLALLSFFVRYPHGTQVPVLLGTGRLPGTERRVQDLSAHRLYLAWLVWN